MCYTVKEVDLDAGKSQLETQFFLQNFFKGWQFRDFGPRFDGFGVVFPAITQHKSFSNMVGEGAETKKSPRKS